MSDKFLSPKLETLLNFVENKEIESTILNNKYYIMEKLESFEKIKYLLAVNELVNCNKELILQIDEATYLKEHDFRERILHCLDIRIERLNFYYNKNHPDIDVLAFEVGYILDRLNIFVDIAYEIFVLISRQYPSVLYTCLPSNLKLDDFMIEVITNKTPKYKSCYRLQIENGTWSMETICEFGKYEYIKYLSDMGYNWANIKECFTAACKSDSRKLVKFLYGKLQDEKLDMRECINNAYKNLDILKYIIENFDTSIYEQHLCVRASIDGKLQTLKYLLSRNTCNMNKLLEHATDVSVIQYLMTYEIDKQDVSLFYASLKKGYLPLVKLLYKNIKPKLDYKIIDMTDDILILKYLIKKGAQITVKDLSYAIYYDKFEKCKFFVDLGVMTEDNQNKFILYALSATRNKQYVDICELILKNVVGPIPYQIECPSVLGCDYEFIHSILSGKSLIYSYADPRYVTVSLIIKNMRTRV